MKSAMQLPQIRLVLVSPKFPGNVGLCVRAAANFGVCDIVVVAPRCDIRGEEARVRATPPADEDLDRVREVPTLAGALTGCVFAAGFTRREGKGRETSLLTRWIATELPRVRAGERVALVFGNERTGLTQDELSLCTHAVAIPTTERMPSMNLSHAVVVALAAVRSAVCGEDGENAAGDPAASPAPLEEFEELFEHWRQVLLEIGMRQGGNPERFLRRLRGIFQGGMGSADVRLFRAFLSKIQVALGTRKSTR